MPALRIMAALLCAALTTGLLLALHLTPIRPNSYLWQELKNFGHAPLFGAIALLIFGMLINVPGIRTRKRTTIYLLTFAMVLLLGAGSELMQLYGPRDADIWDFAKDAAGALSALALLASIDGRLLERKPWRRKRFRRYMRILATALVLAAFTPAALLLEAYNRQAAQIPTLMSFDSSWQLKLVENNGAFLRLVEPPENWVEIDQERVGEVTFTTSRKWPGLIWREPYPDWTGYTYFSMELFSELDHPVDVNLRIDDAGAGNWAGDRFNLRWKVPPGASRVRIPLEDVRTAPEDREMNLDDISMMVLFAVHPEEPSTIYLADMKLE
jgi:hypothetical protein